MFGSKPLKPADTLASPPPPERERRPAAEARAFRPSTFASRRGDASSRPQGRRLASLGKSDWQRHLPRGDTEVVEVELFVGVDHPVERFIKFPGQPLAALQDHSQRTERVTTLPPVKGRRLSRPAGAHPASMPDPPAQRV